MQIERLIARIRGQLDLNTPDLEARSLASEYAALCLRTRERLEQCVALIRSGNDHAAFEVAESDPDLLGLCAHLSFAESERWNALCRERGLPPGLPLDSQHVIAVEGLYGKAIGENHPLYRDYRDAIRTHDEDRALSVLRSIVRINPDDPNARAELTRLSTKFLREALGKVNQLFESQKTEDAVHLMDRMERFGANALTDDARWNEALAKRQTWLRAKAVEQIRQQVTEAQEARRGDHWEACAGLIGRARSLERDHQVTLPAELHIELSHLEAWAGELAAEAEKEASLRSATQAIIDEWTQLQQESARQKSPAILIARLKKWIERASPFEDRLPEGMLRDARSLSQITRTRLNQRYSLMVTSWVIGLLCVLAGFGWWHYKNKLTDEAQARFVSAHQLASEWRHTEALEALEDYKSKNPSLASEPSMVEDEKKLRETISKQEAIEQNLRAEAIYLEARRQEGVSLNNFANTAPRVNAYLVEIEKVGPAAQKHLEAVLADPSALKAACERISEQAQGELTAGRSSLKKALGDEETVTNPVQAVEAVDHLRQLLSSLRKAGIKDLDAADAEVDRAEERLHDERKVATSLKTLTDAADLKSYLDALLAAKASSNEKSELSKRAGMILEKGETLVKLPRAILAPRVGAMWDATTSLDLNANFMPDTLLEGESKILRQLSDDAVARSLRKFNVRQYSSQGVSIIRTAYVVGEISLDKHLITDGLEYVLKGKELTREGIILESTWSRREFTNGAKSGEDLQEGVLIPEMEYLRQFGRFYDVKAGKLNEPILRTLDRVRRNPSPNLEIRAYHLQELFKLASLHPEISGMIYSPSAQRDAEELRRITQNSMGAYDFLFKDKWADIQGELKSYLNRNTSTNYADEARFWRSVFVTLRSHKLIFAGMVEQNGKPNLRDKIANTTLYGLDTEGRATVLFRIGNDGAATRVAEAAPFTPLLRYPGSVEEAVKAANLPTNLIPPDGGWESLLQGRDL
jgi:hypothetical protein